MFVWYGVALCAALWYGIGLLCVALFVGIKHKAVDTFEIIIVIVVGTQRKIDLATGVLLLFFSVDILLFLFQINGKQRCNKPVFFIECGIHAREWISPATCMYMIDQVRHASFQVCSVFVRASLPSSHLCHRNWKKFVV